MFKQVKRSEAKSIIKNLAMNMIKSNKSLIFVSNGPSELFKFLAFDNEDIEEELYGFPSWDVKTHPSLAMYATSEEDADNVSKILELEIINRLTGKVGLVIEDYDLIVVDGFVYDDKLSSYDYHNYEYSLEENVLVIVD